MINVQPIKDPFKNHIYIPTSLNKSESNYNHLRMVLEFPSFVIATTVGTYYYIKSIESGLNMLVETKKEHNYYKVYKYTINPNAEDIATILKKGRLSSFDY